MDSIESSIESLFTSNKERELKKGESVVYNIVIELIGFGIHPKNFSTVLFVHGSRYENGAKMKFFLDNLYGNKHFDNINDLVKVSMNGSKIITFVTREDSGGGGEVGMTQAKRIFEAYYRPLVTQQVYLRPVQQQPKVSVSPKAKNLPPPPKLKKVPEKQVKSKKEEIGLEKKKEEDCKIVLGNEDDSENEKEFDDEGKGDECEFV